MKFDDFKIKQLCDKYLIKNYTIENGIVNVNKSVDLAIWKLTEFPIKFGTINGRFDCNDNKLTTLEGSPNIVNGDFNCYNNILTTLKGSLNLVQGDFDCKDNKLTNLLGAPKIMGEIFKCKYNPVYSIYQTDKNLVDQFNYIFDDCSSINWDQIEFWFSIIKKEFSFKDGEEIKRHYDIQF
jgi:hypothetical protein